MPCLVVFSEYLTIRPELPTPIGECYTAKWLGGHSLLSLTSPNLRELSEGRRSCILD